MEKIKLFALGAKKLISDNFAPTVKSHGKEVLIHFSIMAGFVSISQILGWVACRISQSLFNMNLSFANSEYNELAIGVILIFATAFVFALVLYVKDFIKKAIEQGDLEIAKRDLEITKNDLDNTKKNSKK